MLRGDSSFLLKVNAPEVGQSDPEFRTERQKGKLSDTKFGCSNTPHYQEFNLDYGNRTTDGHTYFRQTSRQTDTRCLSIQDEANRHMRCAPFHQWTESRL